MALFCEGFINIFFGESPYIYHYHLLFSDFYAAEIVISIRSPCWEKHTEKLSWVYPPGMFCCFHGRLFDAKRTKKSGSCANPYGPGLGAAYGPYGPCGPCGNGAFFVWEPSGK